MEIATPEKKGMHPLLKFILMMIVGGLVAAVFTPCFLGAMNAANKSWTLKQQYSAAIYLFVGGAIGSFILTLICVFAAKRSGRGGFFFGVALVLACALPIALMMRMFDEPNMKARETRERLEAQEAKDAKEAKEKASETPEKEPK